MGYGLKSFASFDGLKLICGMGGYMLTEPKAASKVCIHYMAMSYEHYDHCRGTERVRN